MKRIALMILSVLTVFSCTDLTGIQEQLNDHESRIAKLELLCSQMNTNIESMKTIVDAMEKGDYITDVKTFELEGKEVGYVVSFAKGKDITIYHGKNGVDGNIAAAPKIGVKKDVDGVYYWTINADWLLDEAGNKIQAQGKDGEDAVGKPGQDGHDGLTPELKIDGGYWYVRYGTGEWRQLGKATGEDGLAGPQGDSLFKSVCQTATEVTFVLTNGEVIVLPKKQNSSLENNKIYYTTSDGNIANPNSDLTFARFGACLISNVYENGQGVMTFDGDVRFLGTEAFKDCLNLKSITLPESVRTFENAVFWGCTSLETFQWPSRINLIPESAFRDCSSLISITIPEGVTAIGSNAFDGCSSLTSLTIPKSVTTIGTEIFRWCSSLETFRWPSGINSIPDFTFGDCTGLTSVTIPEGVTTIGRSAFLNCSNLTSVIISEGVTTIGLSAFEGCTSLPSVTIPGSVVTIGSKAFISCTSLISITIPEGVTTIAEGIFSNCTSLTSVNIPVMVEKISSGAFFQCSSLTSITIPENVVSIGGSAFAKCTNLISIFVKAIVPPKYSFLTFEENATERKFYVPMESLETYKSASGWSGYAADIVGYDFSAQK